MESENEMCLNVINFTELSRMTSRKFHLEQFSIFYVKIWFAKEILDNFHNLCDVLTWEKVSIVEMEELLVYCLADEVCTEITNCPSMRVESF